MPKKTEHGWICNYCKKPHRLEAYAISCEQSHEIVYIGLRREDLFKLIQFIYTGDRDLITESLMKDLKKYRKGTM